MFSSTGLLRLSATVQVRTYATALKSVGFIGLGNMGSRMAANLQKAGHPMVVYDINAASADDLVKKGAVRAASPAEVAKKTQLLVTMLPSSPHVQEVYEGKNGIFANAAKGSVFIDASTINPTVAQSVAANAVKQGFTLIDAPVSGGTGGAEAGTLTFMVGATPENFKAVEPVLQRMGKKIVHCGASGTGQIAKVANNLVLGISMLGVAEAMNLGTKLGIDAKTLADIFNSSSARCWSSDTYNPCPGVMQNVPSARGFTGGFGTDLMLKDLSLATEAASKAGVPLTMGGSAQQLYRLMSAQGLGHKDFSAIWEFLQPKKKQN